MNPAVDSAIDTAKSHASRGELELALETMRHCLRRHPDSRPAIDAFKTFNRLRALQVSAASGMPRDRLARLMALFRQGRADECLAQCEAAVKQYPAEPVTANLLGALYVDRGRLNDGIECYKAALQALPGFAEAHSNLGDALHASGRSQEAVDSYRQALRLDPDLVETLINLGAAYNALGNRDAAAASFRRVLEIDPNFASAYRLLSTVKTFAPGDPDIQRMRDLIDQPGLSASARVQIDFALAKAFDDIGDVEQSFGYLADGNRRHKRELNYDSRAIRTLHAKIKTAFSKPTAIADVPDRQAGVLAARPVFITGMPRSGTSLVEQILASHSAVHGAGELPFLGRSIDVSALQSGPPSPSQLRSVRNAYAAGLATLGVERSCVTDKMPGNFWWIGFIATAMPEASIIHVSRDARATCWSNFRHFFPDAGSAFSYDLQDLCEYYRLYADLMEFWTDRFPGRIYELGYENLTENQQRETRRLLDHIGLPWEAECLEFHGTVRAVQTASSQQVRREMYEGSSEAWKKYAAYLGPMVELLQDL